MSERTFHVCDCCKTAPAIAAKYCNDCGMAYEARRDELEQIRADHAEAVRILGGMEWSGGRDGDECHECGAYVSTGVHYRDCALARLIGATVEGEP